ncbi:DUF1360 domain-containing protein [Alloacidobacterium dinghuense]|uniref:DUF1360 domain-containing protein n=1 Tax=Alloacidobacterium dinghuense TaxID=2763107 RepID=A0A7G8BK63_9BACT|nr:DUF1360 domain-containing protein [Alloacidobacterium dinghuense]QNI32933.1 DUF1360 domain-containing protein [Alloacidobacterium dinghuense]
METNTWFRFVIAALAVWRLSHLLAAEDGPWDLIVRLRRNLGTTIWGKLMDCFYCLSIWISIPFALFVVSGMLDRIVVWLALSGAASLANKFIKEPVIFEPPADV